MFKYTYTYIWSNYSDLTQPHPKWWLSKGHPFISGQSRLLNLLFHLPRYIRASNPTYKPLLASHMFGIIQPLLAEPLDRD